MEVVDEFRDEGERVAILYGEGIQDPIILYQTKRAILLFDEDGEGHWGLKGAYSTRLEVLLEEGI